MLSPVRPSTPDPVQEKLKLFANPSYALCKEDMIWLMEHIRDRMSRTDDLVLREHPDRLLREFRLYAEIASHMIRGQIFIDDDPTLKRRILECAKQYQELPQPS